MWQRLNSTWKNRVSLQSIDSSSTYCRSFPCGNESLPHGNDFILRGNESIPYRNEPKTPVGSSKRLVAGSKRHRNDRNLHGAAAEPIGFEAKLVGFGPTPHGSASNPPRQVFCGFLRFHSQQHPDTTESEIRESTRRRFVELID